MRQFSTSLKARIAWQLILFQLAALTIFIAIIAIPPVDQRGVRQLDDSVLGLIAANLVVEADRLALRPDSRLQRIIADYPDFWFYVGNGHGDGLRHGAVPELIAGQMARLDTTTELKLRWQSSDAELSLIAERMDGPAGRLIIASGGGPTILPVLNLIQNIKGYYLALLGLLTVLTVAAIPWILNREFRGLSRVEAEARRIDIEQPGARLSEVDVPSELRALVRAVNAALARLDDGLEKRKRFLATAAHELRTPIAVLTTRIETMAPGPERSRLMLDVSRLALLADQLLDSQRLEYSPIPSEPVDLAEIAGAAVADIAPLAIASDCELSFDAPPRPVMIRADPQAVARVVTNLVQNAIVHGGPGTAIVIEVATPAELRVRDNGPGVEPCNRDRIFEPFYRPAANGAGSGLGLNLVQDIVTRYGGRVHVTGAPGGGAEFVVRFPPSGEQKGSHQSD